MKLFNKYKFSDKNQTVGGTISLLLAVASIAILAYGVSLAAGAQGKAGIEVGSLGIVSFMVAVIGTVIGFLSFREDDKFYTFSKIGTFACGFICIFMLAVFVMGI